MKTGQTPPSFVEAGRILLALAATLLSIALLSGCATSGPSDMPWNAPQPWEGSPTIPGFQGQ